MNQAKRIHAHTREIRISKVAQVRAISTRFFLKCKAEGLERNAVIKESRREARRAHAAAAVRDSVLNKPEDETKS